MFSSVENASTSRSAEWAASAHGRAPGGLSQVLLEQMQEAVAILDREMCYLAANRRWIQEFQLQGLPVIGTSHYTLFPDLHKDWENLYADCLAGHRHSSQPDCVVRADGSAVSTRWELDPWYEADGNVGGLVMRSCVIATEAPSRAADAANLLGRALLHGHTQPVFLLDAAGRIRHGNEAARKLIHASGGSLTEGVSFFWNSLYPAVRREAARQRIQALLTAAAATTASPSWPMEGSSALDFPDATSGPTAWTVFRAPSEEPGPSPGILLLARDPSSETPTKGQHTPHVTTDSEYRQFAEAAPFGMIVLTEDAEVVYANPQHRAALGFSVEECGGISAWLERGCAAEEDQRKRVTDEWWERVWQRRAPLTCSMRNADGILKEIEFRPAPLPGHRLLLTVFDVTDARLEEQGLRASEARYRSLFQNCAAAVVVLNGPGNITEVNPVFEKLTGCSRMDVRRNGLSAFLPQEDAVRVREAVTRGLTGQEIPTGIRARDGSVTPVRLSLSVVKNDAGTPVFTACFLYPCAPAPVAATWDTTSPDLLLHLDKDGKITSHSKGRDFATLLPSDTPLTGLTLEAAIPSAAELLPLDIMMARLQENPNAETRCEFALTSPSGRQRVMEARMVLRPATESTTQDPHYGLALRDLSTAMEGKASTSSPASNPLPWLRNVPLPLIITNERGRITGLNPAAAALTGWSQEDLQGAGLYKLFQPDNPRSFSETISRELSSTRHWKSHAILHCRDHTTREVHVDLVPALDEASGGRGFITLLSEIPAPAPAAPVPAPAPAPVQDLTATADPAPEPPPAPPQPTRACVSLHRARNDLQVLGSLLTLQADRKENTPAAREELIAGKNRLSAVSIIYRLISSEEDTVDFSRYAQDMGRTLLENHRIAPEAVKIETPFDSVRLPQKLSITLGLILEELISSSLRDAFCDNGTGSIRISLTIGGGEGVLIVRDTGTLLTESLRSRRLSSFSWHIVETLSSQLGGTLTLLSDLENQVRLRFRLA